MKRSLTNFQRIIKRDGKEGWNLAKKSLLSQETTDLQIKQALSYLTLIPDFFRPAFISYCCKAVGGDPKVTVPTGASIVLLAKAIGIHDSIIDNMKRRNGQVTAFGKFGRDLALVLSDILLFKGFTLLRKNLEIGIPSSTLAKILETIDRIWFEQSEGEILDVKLRQSLNISPEEYLTLIKKKASELEAIARIGGILGGGSHIEIDALGKIGRILGIMSLLRDEIIDMLEFNILKHRIKYESLPLPVIYAAQKANVKSEIHSIMSKKKLTITDMKKLSRTVDEAAGISQTASHIFKEAKRAENYLSLFKVKVEEFKILIDSLLIYPSEWKPLLEPTQSNSKLV
jgi:geranylgeranyl pyrophosphate synthase